jgi:hypothetical protein
MISAFHAGLLTGLALGIVAGFICCILIQMYLKERKNVI